jgi:Reverse transcriptase (RNA-dependent DNA polymerase)
VRNPPPARNPTNAPTASEGTTPHLRRSTQSNFGAPPPRFSPQFTVAATLADEAIALSDTDRADGISRLVELNAAPASNPDLLDYDQVMHAPDADLFKDGMKVEISLLIKQDTFDVVPKQEAKDAGQTILPGTWAFRRKRRGDGTIKKHKALYCVRGDLQKDVFNTFAPVVQSTTIRLMMVYSLVYGLRTECIDFSNAFVQAKPDKPVYIHLPCGFRDSQNRPDMCLKLKKSLYGLKIAPKLWSEHLSTRLKAMGFKQSRLDPCLFSRNKVILCMWVVCICAKTAEGIQQVIAELQTEFALTEEGELSEYLGLTIKRDTGKSSFELTQNGLIEKIIKAVGMEDSNPNHIPANETLGSCKDELKHDKEWSDPSVIGMLLYLTGNTRPDIAFAVNQCAHFNHDPRRSHSKAVKKIVRYLIKTRTKGLIVRPNGKLTVDCFCDADSAGLWNKEDHRDPISAKSRTGYVIMFAGCPVVWVSKLQTEIALSTMEAEYMALSHSLRQLLHLCRVVEEIGKELAFQKELSVSTHSEIFEDNAGALTLANSP